MKSLALTNRFVLVGLVSVSVWLTQAPALSIPSAVETNLSLSLPTGLTEMTDPDGQNALTRPMFVMQGSETDAAPNTLTLRTLPEGETKTVPTLLTGNEDDIRLIGRYPERLHHLDLDILDAELQTNTLSDPERLDRTPFRSDLFLLDLSKPTEKTNELEMIMRTVAKTIADQDHATPSIDKQGVISAIMYLLMVVIIILVAIARR